MPFNLTVEQTQLVLEKLLPIATALAIFGVGWILSKWGHALVLKALRTSRLDEVVSRFFASIAQWAILAFVFIAALEKAGVETASLAAIVAAAGLAIGLALQGTLGNFAGGVLLLVLRPFTIGDRVTVAGQHGQVEDIGLFATTLSTPARERIILPNSAVTSASITNHTASGNLQTAIDIGVAYGADVDEVCGLLLQAADECEFVLKDPGPRAGLIDFAASSLSFRVICWSEPKLGIAVQIGMRAAIYNKLNAAGVEIPFPQLVVHQAPV